MDQKSLHVHHVKDNMRTGHLSVQKGKRVMVHFKDGSKLITKFIEKKGKTIRTEAGNFQAGDLRTLTIWKHDNIRHNTTRGQS